MVTDLADRSRKLLRKPYVSFLAFLWVFGLHSGLLISQPLAPFFTSLMRRMCVSSVSIVGVLLRDLLPLFLCILFVKFHVVYAIGLLVLLKGFFFGYSSGLILLGFSSFGWLIRLFVSISQQPMVVLFLWFVFRRIRWENRLMQKDICIYICFATVLYIIERFFAAPYLRGLLNT